MPEIGLTMSYWVKGQRVMVVSEVVMQTLGFCCNFPPVVSLFPNAEFFHSSGLGHIVWAQCADSMMQVEVSWAPHLWKSLPHACSPDPLFKWWQNGLAIQSTLLSSPSPWSMKDPFAHYWSIKAFVINGLTFLLDPMVLIMLLWGDHWIILEVMTF